MAISEVFDGDMAVIRDGSGYVVGVYESSTRVIFGDVVREVVAFAELVIPKRHISPEAGRFIGRRFDSIGAAQDALGPLLTEAWYREHGERVPVAASAEGGACR